MKIVNQYLEWIIPQCCQVELVYSASVLAFDWLVAVVDRLHLFTLLLPIPKKRIS